MKLTEGHLEILMSAATVGRWYVDAANLADVGELVRAGLINAVDDYEGPELGITEAGRDVLLRRKLIRKDDSQSGYSRA